tara:strand:+ start:17504 stop:18007 length:504 start_codon:yes stop_codon:yes gene_type:complete
MVDMNWYVVHTNPNKEEIAERHLIRQNYVTYFPRYKKIINHARKISTVVKPLFPRYLFIKIDLYKQRWTSINSTYGVNSLVTMQDKPVRVSKEIINKIKSQEDPDGITEIPFLQNFIKGDEVNIHDGIFSGKKGLFMGLTDDNRVKILFDLLGKEITFSAKNISLVR